MTKDKDPNELITNEQLREQLIDRIEVLDKVKTLLLIPSTEFGTVKQIADFYEVPNQAIQSLVNDNMDELKSDGFALYKRKEIISILNVLEGQLETVKGKTIVTLEDGNEVLEVPNRGLRLFPRRAILRVGMLLKESEIALEVRNQLLNIEENTPVEVKVAEINEEQKPMVTFAEKIMATNKSILMRELSKVANPSQSFKI